MIQLDSGNVLLKPSQRRQLMTWLRRALRIGQRLGNFALQITMRRCGRSYEIHARVHDSAGDFHCRTRRHDWRNAVRDLAKMLSNRLHDQRLLQMDELMPAVAIARRGRGARARQAPGLA
jgi:ribosomal protein L37E